MVKSNVDVGVFQETKLTDGIYTRGLAGYKVAVTLAPIRHRCSVMLLYQDPPPPPLAFAVEVIC